MPHLAADTLCADKTQPEAFLGFFDANKHCSGQLYLEMHA
jgi:hypothetical protein